MALVVHAADALGHRLEPFGRDLAAAVDAKPVAAIVERPPCVLHPLLLLVEDHAGGLLELLGEGLGSHVAGVLVVIGELLARPLATVPQNLAAFLDLPDAVVEPGLHLDRIDLGHAQQCREARVGCTAAWLRSRSSPTPRRISRQTSSSRTTSGWSRSTSISAATWCARPTSRTIRPSSTGSARPTRCRPPRSRRWVTSSPSTSRSSRRAATSSRSTSRSACPARRRRRGRRPRRCSVTAREASA